ncbi:hypothetical protein OAZ80_01610 [bacterium]|nr:hypothetical protein [bacterium]
MTGVGVSWSAPAWVGQSDEEYRKMLRRKAMAVTRRDKRRDGKYSVKEAIEAIHQAFHRCNGFDPYDGSKLNPKLLGEYKNEDAKAEGAAHKRRFAMLPTVDHVTARPVADFEIVSWQTNDAKGDMPPEEFIAYCRRVVRVTDQQGSDRR